MTVSPLDMPTRRPVTQTQGPVLRYSTDTATAAHDRQVRAEALAAAAAAYEADRLTACPGSNGEISSSMCRTVYGDRCCCW